MTDQAQHHHAPSDDSANTAPRWQRLEYHVQNHIARVCFDRPEKMNALDMQTFAELQQVQQQIAADSSIRVVILSANGEHFCAGLDIQSVMSDPGAVETLLSPCPTTPHSAETDLPPGESAAAYGNYVQQMALGWRQLKVPVIAVLKGYVFGGGLQIALGADFRIADPQSQLSVMEIRWGIIPDMGLSVLAPSLVARDQLKLLAMTGERVSGDQAQALGLVTRVDKHPEQAAQALAETLVQHNPCAVQGVKTLLDAERPPREQLALEEQLQRRLLFSPNQLEAVQANLQKRAAVFPPR